MAKAIESYEFHTMDFTARIEAAKSESGRYFKRIQVRDPRYGYKWSKWSEVSASVAEGRWSQGPKKWRLPA